MNNAISARQFVEGTSHNADHLTAYLRDLPGYLDAATRVGVSPQALDLIVFTEYFEYHFKRYLSGHRKTLHRVFYEVGDFIAFDAEGARRMIGFSLDAVQAKLLTEEWYEIMPRYNLARRRIEKRFGLHFETEFKWLVKAP